MYILLSYFKVLESSFVVGLGVLQVASGKNHYVAIGHV